MVCQRNVCSRLFGDPRSRTKKYTHTNTKRNHPKRDTSRARDFKQHAPVWCDAHQRMRTVTPFCGSCVTYVRQQIANICVGCWREMHMHDVCVCVCALMIFAKYVWSSCVERKCERIISHALHCNTARSEPQKKIPPMLTHIATTRAPLPNDLCLTGDFGSLICNSPPSCPIVLIQLCWCLQRNYIHNKCCSIFGVSFWTCWLDRRIKRFVLNCFALVLSL